VSDSVAILRPRDAPEHRTRIVAWTVKDDASYVFPQTEAITIDPSAFECSVMTERRWQCRYKKSPPASPEQFKYKVRLVPKSGTRQVDVLDPWVVTN
jgi:hypothetical protein